MMHKWSDDDDLWDIECKACGRQLLPDGAGLNSRGSLKAWRAADDCPGPDSTDARADLGTTKEDTMPTTIINNVPPQTPQPFQDTPDEFSPDTYYEADSMVAQFAGLDTADLRVEIMRRPLAETLLILETIETVEAQQRQRIHNGQQLGGAIRNIIAERVEAASTPSAGPASPSVKVGRNTSTADY